MKVASDRMNVIHRHIASERHGSVSAGQVYASQRLTEGRKDHDPRGLVVAILMCMACWIALGYFLLR